MPNTNKYYPFNNIINNPSGGSNQFVIRRYGRSYNNQIINGQRNGLPNIRMNFIKSNNWYYKSHTAVGRVGQSSQAGNLNAIRRRV